jgi:uncharacterized protein YuzE
MRMRYDKMDDALYLRLDESKVVDSEEVQAGIVLDFNSDDQVVGIEVLDLRRRLPSADPKQLKFEVF